ncbi:MAG: RNA polymerase sigma factor [Actinomycetota bacterium]
MDRTNTAFDEFFETVGTKVRRALVSAYGIEVGTEAAADAMLEAWHRWPGIASMANPAGYLFRVGQSRSRRHLRWRRRNQPFSATEVAPDRVDRAELMDMFRGLDQLTPIQRSAVLLTRAYGLSYAEAAEVLGVTESALTNHIHRGTKRLRELLEVSP